MSRLYHRFQFHLLAVIGLLLLTVSTVSAHPVLTPNETVSVVGTLISVLRIVSLAVTAGWAAYTLLGDTATINRRWYAVAWGLALISLWSDLALDWAVTNDTLIDTSYFNFTLQMLNFVMQSERAGMMWVRIIGAVLLGAPLLQGLPVSRWIAVIGGLIVALASSWAAATPAAFTADAQVTVPPSGQWSQLTSQGMHLYLGALWFGGLIVGTTSLLRNRQNQAAQKASRQQFMRYMQLCFAAIGVTGVVLAWIRIGSVTALLQTGYGWLTLLKVGLLISLMVSGMRIAWQGASRQTAMLQGALVGIVLIASGMLTTLSSGRSVAEWRADEYFHSFDNSFYDARIERPLEIDLIVIPGLTGENRFIVTLIDSEVGARLDDAQSVVVNLTNTQSEGEPLTVTLEPAVDGNYLAVTTLAEDGDWNAQVEVSRQEITRSADFAFTLNVPPPELPNLLSIEQLVTFTPLDRMVSGAGGVLLVLLGASEMFSMRRRRNSHQIVMLLSGLCAVIGLTLLVACVL